MAQSFTDLLGKLFDKLDGPFIVRWLVPFAGIVAIAASYLLLHPPIWMTQITGVPLLSTEEKKWLSITLVVATLCCLLYIPFILVYSIAHRPKKEKRADPLQYVIKEISNLSNEEQLLLAICLYRNRQAFTASTAAPVVQHLMHRGFVSYGGTMGYQRQFPFMIVTKVWNYLKEHPEALTSGWIKEVPELSNEQLERAWRRVISDGMDFFDYL
jgi:hypothetical protein